jgi:hypothetical protein
VIAEEGFEREIMMARGKSEDRQWSYRKEKEARSEERNVGTSCDARRRASDLPTPLATDSQFFFKASCVYEQYSDYLLRQQVFAVAILQ